MRFFEKNLNEIGEKKIFKKSGETNCLKNLTKP